LLVQFYVGLYQSNILPTLHTTEIKFFDILRTHFAERLYIYSFLDEEFDGSVDHVRCL
jgi:hypothetical protein